MMTVKLIVSEVPAVPVPLAPVNGVAFSVYDPTAGVHGL